MFTTRLLVPRRSSLPVHALAFRDLDRLFDPLWRGAASAVPRIDVTETDAELRIAAELPGLDEKDIGVAIENDVLTIRGDRTAAAESESAGVRHRETWRGTLERSLRLPGEVDVEAVTAVYRNGILTVTLPKVAAAAARSIPVTGAA